MTTETNEQLLREMVRIRRIEETLAELYPSQEMRTPTHFSIGQEAVAVGVCSALRRTDAVYSGHRCHAHYLAKGGDLSGMVARLKGLDLGRAEGIDLEGLGRSLQSVRRPSTGGSAPGSPRPEKRDPAGKRPSRTPPGAAAGRAHAKVFGSRAKAHGSHTTQRSKPCRHPAPAAHGATKSRSQAIQRFKKVVQKAAHGRGFKAVRSRFRKH